MTDCWDEQEMHEMQSEWEDRLMAENSKLRDLCADLAAHLLEAERVHNDHLMPDGYKERMRELGIEVD